MEFDRELLRVEGDLGFLDGFIELICIAAVEDLFDRQERSPPLAARYSCRASAVFGSLSSFNPLSVASRLRSPVGEMAVDAAANLEGLVEVEHWRDLGLEQQAVELLAPDLGAG